MKQAHELFEHGVLLTFNNEALVYHDPIINQRVGMLMNSKFIVDASGNPCTKAYDGFYLENSTLYGYVEANGGTTRVVVDYEAANKTVRDMWKYRKK